MLVEEGGKSGVAKKGGVRKDESYEKMKKMWGNLV